MVKPAFIAREPKKRGGRGKTRYRGIVADAAALGVTYMHLYRVLSGERQSPGLLSRYAERQTEKAAR